MHVSAHSRASSELLSIAILGIAAVGLTVASCTSAGSVSRATSSSSARDLEDPQAATYLAATPDRVAHDLAVIDLNVARFARECMTSLGFSEYVMPPEAQAVAAPVGFYWGPIDPATANSLGYLTAAPTAQELSTEPEVEDPPPAETQTPQYQLALVGGPDETSVRQLKDSRGNVLGETKQVGGCYGRASQHVFESSDRRVEYIALAAELQDAAAEVMQEALAAPEVRDAAHRWAQCMNQAGLNYSEPDQARLFAWPHPRPSPDERRTAAADAECKVQVGYIAAINRAYLNQAATIQDTFASQDRRYTVLLEQILSSS